MRSKLRMSAMLLAVLVVAASASQAEAQVVVYRSAPVVSYYSPPVVSYYYTPPVVSYHAAPAVSYYTPAYAPATVTTYQGVLPWRRYTVATYGTPAYVVPAPVTRYYYTPGYVWR
jgi:hypothetical protein